MLICSTTYGGCGHIGTGEDWEDLGDPDEEFPMEFLACRYCGEDHCFQLTPENYINLTEESNREEARRIVMKERR